MHDIIALPSFVFGFHGCDRMVAEKVLAGEEILKPSENAYDWLGSGIYFWEHNPARALEWATEAKARGGVNEPAVLGAIIDLGNCLNLLDATGLRILKEGYLWLLEAVEQSGLALPINKDIAGNQDLLLRHLDCAVINLIHELSDEHGKIFNVFDTVRAVFVEGDPIYPTAGFRQKNHIQICVRNSAAIKAFFRVHTATTCPRRRHDDRTCGDPCGLICLD